MTQTPSEFDQAIELAKPIAREFEGLRLMAYRDSIGVITIGYGHTGGVKLEDIITKDRAEELLDLDLQKAAAAVLERVQPKLDPNELAALALFVMNLGPGALSESTLLKRVNDGSNGDIIRAEFMRWVYAGGVVLPGLEKRRAAEADLYLGT